MVCCEAYPNLQMWQHAELVTDCKRARGKACSTAYTALYPHAGTDVELDRKGIKRQIVKFASYVPKEIERTRVYLSARAKVTLYKVAFLRWPS